MAYHASIKGHFPNLNRNIASPTPDFFSESDNVIENLSLDGMSGSPKVVKVGTGKKGSLFPSNAVTFLIFLPASTGAGLIRSSFWN